MSARTPQQLAAQALRYGLREFWPDQQHWAKLAFYKPIVAYGNVTEDRARCVQQMISDSVMMIMGVSHPVEQPRRDFWRQVREIAGQAIIQSATGDRPAERRESAESYLVSLNDHPDRTYEQMKSYVEAAACELEKAC